MKSNSYPVLALLRHCLVNCCIAAVLCLSACHKKPVDVSGQVFIVNPDGKSEKMVLAGIHVLGDKEFKALAASVLDRLAEADRRVAQANADDSAFDTAESLCKLHARRDYTVPGLDGVVDEVRARHHALGSPGSPATFDDLLDGMIAALPAEVTRTDADGRFSIPLDRKVWVIASSRRKVGERGEDRLWVVPCEAGKTGKAAPLLLANNGLVPDIHAFAALAGRDWQEMSGNKMSATPGVAAWVVAAVAKADALAADAGLRHAMAMTCGSGN